MFALDVMHVVRRYQRQAELLCPVDEHAIDLLLLRYAVVLQLDVKIARLEDVPVFERPSPD